MKLIRLCLALGISAPVTAWATAVLTPEQVPGTPSPFATTILPPAP